MRMQKRGLVWLPEYKPTIDPDVKLPPIDPKVKLPRQVLLAVERAEDLIAGRPPRPVKAVPNAARPSDVEIDAVLKRWNQGVFDPELRLILDLARGNWRGIKARRRGALKTSEAVTRRLEALFQAYRELPSALQQHPTARETVARLRVAVSKKVGGALTEDTVRHDMKQIRPLMRLVQTGKWGLPSTPELEERTRQEQEAGRRAVARAEANPDPWRAIVDEK
jgi:hypothetical protein